MLPPHEVVTSVLGLVGLTSWLGGPKKEQVQEGGEELVVVYTSDDLDLVLHNYGGVRIGEDLPYEALYALADFFEHAVMHPEEDPWDNDLPCLGDFDSTPTSL